MTESHELRCSSKLHAVVVAPGVVEFACRSRYCGWEAGKIVLHRFEVDTGKLLGTREYRTIEMQIKEG